MMTEPTYSFTIPSIHDDTPLDCRIYHPRQQSTSSSTASSKNRKAAVIAHPYPPFGGSLDDACVLAVAEALLAHGFIVATFNFRGAGTSAGKTSWTGRPEVDDFCSVAGLMVYYLRHLLPDRSPDDDDDHDDDDHVLSTVISIDGNEPAVIGSSSTSDDTTQQQTLLLAGYSFGALILSRLPSLPSIIQRLSTAEPGTAASEIFLRARTLAKQQQNQQTQSSKETPPRHRGRNFHHHPSSSSSPTKITSSLLLLSGGEETPPSTRRRSRDSRRSVEVLREMPQNFKSHLQHARRQSGLVGTSPPPPPTTGDTTTRTSLQSNSRGSNNRRESNRRRGSEGRRRRRRRRRPAEIPTINTLYLLISPVLFPLSTTLLSPGVPFTMGSFSPFPSPPSPPASSSSSSSPLDDQEERRGGGGGGVLALRDPMLVVFGSSDTFTSSKKLRQWAARLQREAPERVCWEQIDGAGHFWRENGVMQALQARIQEWVREEADTDVTVQS